ISDARQASHEAGRVNTQRRTTQVFISADTIYDGPRPPVRLGIPWLVLQKPSRLQEQLQASKIAMAQRVVVAKSVIESGVHGCIDFPTDFRIVELRKCREPRQTDPRGTVAPRG